MKAAKLGFLVFSVAILAFLVVYANPARFAQIMQSANISLIALGIGVATLSITLRTVRWWVLLPGAKFSSLMPIQLLGMTISNFTPGKVGEPAKTVILKLRTGTDVSMSLPSIVWERLLDVIVLLILTAIALSVIPLSGNLFYLSLVGTVVFTAFAAIAILMLNARIGRKLFRIFRRLPFLSKISEGFIETFYQAKFSGKRIVASFLVTFVAWVLDGMTIWFALSAIGVSVNVIAAPGILALATIVGIASLLPGGIGGTEAVMAVILGAIGVESSLAITGAILARFMTFWYNQLLGGLSLVYLSRSLEVSNAIKTLIK